MSKGNYNKILKQLYIKKKIKEKGWEGRKGKGDTGRWGQDGRGRRENHQNNTNGSVWIRQMWPSCFYFSAFFIF